MPFWREVPNRPLVINGIIVDMAKSPRLSNILLKVILSSRDSVVVTDARQADNPIIFVNPAFERLTGYTSAEIEGRNCRFLQGDERDQPARSKVRGAVLIGTECQVVIKNFRKDGSAFFNDLSVTPVYDAAGRPQYFIGIQREVDGPQG